MTNGHYFIFLTVLLLLNITVLYSYFLSLKDDSPEEDDDDFSLLSLKQAYFIQAASLVVGAIALFYFSADQTWFFESKFFYFLGLTILLSAIGPLLDSSKKKIAANCFLELIGIIGFVFLLPEKTIFIQTAWPHFVERILTGLAWFIAYRFFCVLAERFEGIIVIQSLHMGFAGLIILLFSSFASVSLLQLNSMLFPIMLMLSPFYCIFRYQLPLGTSMRNFFCLLITGLIFFMIAAGYWGIGALMGAYILFEFIIVVFHFVSNLSKKQKIPLFFFENLVEKTVSKRDLVHVVMYYNLLTDGLILLIIYIHVQPIVVFLAAIFYFKLYMNFMNPESAKAGLLDLFKGAKTTAEIGISGTSQAISDLKKIYAKKTEAEKGNKTDEQP